MALNPENRVQQSPSPAEIAAKWDKIMADKPEWVRAAAMKNPHAAAAVSRWNEGSPLTSPTLSRPLLPTAPIFSSLPPLPHEEAEFGSRKNVVINPLNLQTIQTEAIEDKPTETTPFQKEKLRSKAITGYALQTALQGDQTDVTTQYYTLLGLPGKKPQYSIPFEVSTDGDQPLPPSLPEQQMESIGIHQARILVPLDIFFAITELLLKDPRAIEKTLSMLSQAKTVEDLRPFFAKKT